MRRRRHFAAPNSLTQLRRFSGRCMKLGYAIDDDRQGRDKAVLEIRLAFHDQALDVPKAEQHGLYRAHAEADVVPDERLDPGALGVHRHRPGKRAVRGEGVRKSTTDQVGASRLAAALLRDASRAASLRA